MSSLQEESEKYRPEVEKYLPYLEHRTLDELREEVGKLPVAKELAAEAGHPHLEGAEAGFLLENHARLRAVICNSDNRKLISDLIDAGNVSAVIALLGPVLGIPGAGIPLGIIALAILLLKLGLNEYCAGFTQENRPVSP